MKLAGIDLTATTSFHQLKGEKRPADICPHVPTAGKSINTYGDTVASTLQQEVHRRSPAGITPERPPMPGRPFGLPSARGRQDTVVDALVAGQKYGIEEYLNTRSERVYASTTREPLGKSYVRGHALPEDAKIPKGFGKTVPQDEDVKQVIYARGVPAESEEARRLQIKSHGAYAPGETVDREYCWPEAISANPHFRFGIVDGAGISSKGQGVMDALAMEREAGGAHPRTRIVSRTCEDFRQVANDHLGQGSHLGQSVPPVAPGHAFGAAKREVEFSAGALIWGAYPLEEQMPDRDLGRCTKVGNRNVPTARSLGTPSVRYDIRAPPAERRSIADPRSYGDEADASALIRPQRFNILGVTDSEFTVGRSKGELAGILSGAKYHIEEDDFAVVWKAVVDQSNDEVDSVSLVAFMHVYAELLNSRKASGTQLSAL